MFKVILKEQVHSAFFFLFCGMTPPPPLSVSIFQMILYSLKDHLVSP